MNWNQLSKSKKSFFKSHFELTRKLIEACACETQDIDGITRAEIKLRFLNLSNSWGNVAIEDSGNQDDRDIEDHSGCDTKCRFANISGLLNQVENYSDQADENIWEFFKRLENKEENLSNQNQGDKQTEMQRPQISTTTVKQWGIPSRFEILSQIPNSINCLTILDLNYLDIFTPLLFQILKKTPNMKSITILNSKLSERFKERVTLPQLTDFTLGLIAPNLKDLQRIHYSMFQAFLFFDKLTPWKVDRVAELNTNIKLIINGERIFQIRHADGNGILYSRLTFTNDIMERLTQATTFKLNRLHIGFCSVQTKLIPQNLNQLSLAVASSISAEDLSRCPGVEILKIVCNSPIEPFQFNLAHLLPLQNLKHLFLTRVAINYVPVVVPLESLILDHCILCPRTLEMFVRIFRSSQLLFNWPPIPAAIATNVLTQRLKLLEDIAENSSKTHWISVRNIGNWDKCFHMNDSCDRNCDDCTKDLTIKKLLSKFGLTILFPDFIIRKMVEWEGDELVGNEGNLFIEKSIIKRFEV